MTLPEVEYDIGQEFLLTLHLTPELQEKYGTSNMIVEAVYRGIWSNEKIKEEDVGVLAMAKSAPEHHVVEFGGALYVNDLCGYHGTIEGSSYEPIEVNLEEELSISKEDEEEAEILPPGPRPKVRFFKPGNKEWNIEGLKSARIQGDGPIEVCEETGEELFYLQGDGKKINLRTHAECVGCGRLVGDRAIQHNGSDRAKWPVVYIGAHCTTCWPNKK